MLKSVIADWGKLDEKDKLKYFDRDNDGVVSPEERARLSLPPRDINNPIMQFGVDRSWKGNIRELERVSNAPAATKTTEEKEEAQGIARFNNIKYTIPSSSGMEKVGSTYFPDYYEFGSSIKRNMLIPESAVFLGEDGEEPIGVPKTVNVSIVGYDRASDKVIVMIPPDPELGTWAKAANAAIPLKDCPPAIKDSVNGLKIKTADGVITIGTGTNTVAEPVDIGI